MGKLINYINSKKHNLKTLLIFYYMIIFFVFVAFFIAFTFFSLRSYYYNNLRNLMISQANFSVDIYETSMSRYSIEEIVFNERFDFLNNIDGEVQLLKNNGQLYYDSTGSEKVGKVILSKKDISETNSGYKFNYDNSSKTLSLNYPMVVNNNQIGILRIITGLENVNKDLKSQMYLISSFSILSLIGGFILVYYFAGKFLIPINKLTILAGKLSDGQYNEKSDMSYVGEIGELAKTMDELSSNIIKKEEIKTDFISSVSHELRTPLTSIKGWALTLQDDSLDKNTRIEGLNIIEQEADRLTEMVEDLLDFSRFTSPSFSLLKSNFSLTSVVRNIVNQMKPRSKEKNITILFDFNSENIYITADENRLKQVFINLIDNAIKFTLNNGTIIVSIVEKIEENLIYCEVVDTGIGISEEEIALVTTKFYKGTSKESNTGLGLSICEEIILKHNGKLEIESVIDKGTKVKFTLPIGGDFEKE